MDPQKLSDYQSSYDRIAEEYASRIAGELAHKPLDRMLLDDFAGRVKGAEKRSEEHTSELQSPCNLVCRLLLEKKNNSNLMLELSSRLHYRCKDLLDVR